VPYEEEVPEGANVMPPGECFPPGGFFIETDGLSSDIIAV
jgi:hypothetical protein